MDLLTVEQVPGLVHSPVDLVIASEAAMDPVGYKVSVLAPAPSPMANRERRLRISVPEVPVLLIMVGRTAVALSRLIDLEVQMEATLVPVSARSAVAREMELTVVAASARSAVPQEMEDLSRRTGSVATVAVHMFQHPRPEMEAVDTRVWE